jgi:hypothetical protein
MLQGSLQWSQLIAENPEYLAYVSASPRKSNAIENAFCHKTENFSGSNVDRTIANAYIIRKELSFMPIFAASEMTIQVSFLRGQAVYVTIHF